MSWNCYDSVLVVGCIYDLSLDLSETSDENTILGFCNRLFESSAKQIQTMDRLYYSSILAQPILATTKRT